MEEEERRKNRQEGEEEMERKAIKDKPRRMAPVENVILQILNGEELAKMSASSSACDCGQKRRERKRK